MLKIVAIATLGMALPHTLIASQRNMPSHINTRDWSSTGKSHYLHLLRKPANQGAWDAYKQKHHANDAHERTIRNAEEIAKYVAIHKTSWLLPDTPVYRCTVLSNDRGREYYGFTSLCDYNILNRWRPLNTMTSTMEEAYVTPSDLMPYGAVILYDRMSSDKAVRRAFIEKHANIYRERKGH